MNHDEPRAKLNEMHWRLGRRKKCLKLAQAGAAL